MLAPYADRARSHPGGAIDLSVGTPVDPTPRIAQDALAASANAPGYPTTAGTPALREACAAWVHRRLHGLADPASVLPAIGSKELVGSLPALLGLGPGDRVGIPPIAYPTYAVGAAVAGAEAVPLRHPEELDGCRLIWLNSPSNPTGRVMSAAELAAAIESARAQGAIVASDECYIELGWEERPVSVLSPEVNGGSLEGIIAVHSLSKRSNFAGYRFGFAVGDPALLSALLERRKHLGMMVPAPVQAAAAAALGDDAHVAAQRELYLRRREVIRGALLRAGFGIDHSEAGLYLWATDGRPCWEVVSWFADRGVIVTPGDFYGPGGAHHVRLALTATDVLVDLLPERLDAQKYAPAGG